jgi:osmotically-inducible protein OsmY
MQRFSVFIAALAVAVSAAACGQSDTVTNRNVKAKLLDASQQTREVYAMTKNGVVTLSGTVESPKAKELAVQLARDTQGVTDVIDLIDVEGPAATSGTEERDERKRRK